MKVVITDFALKEIELIHRYYSKNTSKSVADKLANRLFDAIDALAFMPQAGSIELLLRRLRLNHRYIVAGNYKIIFRVETKLIYVTDIFDTRQNPKKLLKRNR